MCSKLQVETWLLLYTLLVGVLLITELSDCQRMKDFHSHNLQNLAHHLACKRYKNLVCGLQAHLGGPYCTDLRNGDQDTLERAMGEVIAMLSPYYVVAGVMFVNSRPTDIKSTPTAQAVRAKMKVSRAFYWVEEFMTHHWENDELVPCLMANLILVESVLANHVLIPQCRSPPYYRHRAFVLEYVLLNEPVHGDLEQTLKAATRSALDKINARQYSEFPAHFQHVQEVVKVGLAVFVHNRTRVMLNRQLEFVNGEWPGGSPQDFEQQNVWNYVDDVED